MTRRNRKASAEYLTQQSGVLFTPERLAALATKGTGPAYSLVNGQAVYETEALDAWLAPQLAAKRPAAGRRDRSAVPA